MQLRQIRHFLAAVDHGSITQASIEQNVTQPTLTRSIQKLEESLKVKLLDRGPGGIALTGYGETFAEHARIIVSDASHASSDLRAMREGRIGHVRLGFGFCAVQDAIAQALADVCCARRDLMMSFAYGELAMLLGKLRRGELDAMVDIWREGIDQAGLVIRDIGAVPMTIVARAGHPLAGRRGLTRADLAGHDWAVFDTPGADSFYCQLLGVERAHNPIRVRSALPGMLNLMVQQSDFLTLTTRSEARAELERGALVEIESDIPPIASRLCLFTRVRASTTTASRYTIDRLIQAMRPH
jgi:DNA-binding transcriptional LysR family regulator